MSRNGSTYVVNASLERILLLTFYINFKNMEISCVIFWVKCCDIYYQIFEKSLNYQTCTTLMGYCLHETNCSYRTHPLPVFKTNTYLRASSSSFPPLLSITGFFLGSYQDCRAPFHEECPKHHGHKGDPHSDTQGLWRRC